MIPVFIEEPEVSDDIRSITGARSVNEIAQV